MFCSKCGQNNPDEAVFCSQCGTSLSEIMESLSVSGNFRYYGRNWKRVKSLAVISLPYYDVAVDDEFIYLIEIPKYQAAAWGILILVTLSLSIIGIVFGIIIAVIGASRDTRKRNDFRGTWIDEDNNIKSKKYEAVTFQKIPLQKASSILDMKKRSFSIVINGNKFTFKTYAKDFEKFMQVINI